MKYKSLINHLLHRCSQYNIVFKDSEYLVNQCELCRIYGILESLNAVDLPSNILIDKQTGRIDRIYTGAHLYSYFEMFSSFREVANK